MKKHIYHNILYQLSRYYIVVEISYPGIIMLWRSVIQVL